MTNLELATVLSLIKQKDTDYDARYPLVFSALAIALHLGMEAGVRVDPEEPEWPVVFIELPTGQVSWHVPRHVKEWDGHTTEEKFGRMARFCLSQLEVVE